MNQRRHFDHRREPAPIRALQGWTAHWSCEVSLALAIANDEPNDWRIALLTWLYALDDTHTEAIAYRMALIVEAVAKQEAIRVDAAAVAAIVSDVMRGVRRVRGEAPLSASARALQLGMRKRSLLRLRSAAESALLRGLEWAMVRYLGACGIEIQRKQDEVDKPIQIAA